MEQERRDADGGKEDHRRVDHRALHLVLDLLRLFGKLGQTVQHDFQHAAGLAGLDHVDVEVVEHLRVGRERIRERAAAGDVLGDAVEAVHHRGGHLLLFQHLDTAHQGKARVHQRRELTRKGRQILGLHAAAQEARQLDVDFDVLVKTATLLRRGGLGRLRALRRLGGGSRCTLHFPDRAREKPVRANGRNRRRAVARLDRAALLLSRAIKRDILESRHVSSLC